MEWISVEERLPELGMGVLVSDGKMVTAVEREKGYLADKLSWGAHEFGGYEWEWDFDEDDITYWMPLPDLPKKEGEEDG